MVAMSRDAYDENKFQFEAPFTEYGHLGAPIFNYAGHLVGISYKEWDAWSVSFLQWAVFSGAETRRYYATPLYIYARKQILLLVSVNLATDFAYIFSYFSFL